MWEILSNPWYTIQITQGRKNENEWMESEGRRRDREGKGERRTRLSCLGAPKAHGGCSLAQGPMLLLSVNCWVDIPPGSVSPNLGSSHPDCQCCCPLETHVLGQNVSCEVQRPCERQFSLGLFDSMFWPLKHLIQDRKGIGCVWEWKLVPWAHYPETGHY